MSGRTLGIDLGGTKTEGVVLAQDGRELLRHRVKTVRGDYRATLGSIAALVSHLEQQTGGPIARIGVGIPGSLSPISGLVRNANSTWINGRPLGADLAATLGRPVRLANDANCLALSEITDGAAQGARSVFAVILGTGVGGGIAIDGRLVSGAHGLAGEWGHIPMPVDPDASKAPTPARQCYCGRKNCVETFLAGPAISAEYGPHEGVTGVADIVRHAQAGQAHASAVLARFENRLARALGVVVNTLDPDIFVLGGGVSRIPDLATRLPQKIAPHIFAAPSDRVEISVKLAQWGDSSGVRGAARLWEDT